MNYRETTLFFLPQGTAKKRERSIKIRFIYYILFQQPCDPVKMVSPFRLFGLFFSFFVSLFRLLTSASKKKQHPLRESRERERALLPSWCIFPKNKKSSQHDDCERRRDIYIYILTHTRVTQNTSQYSTTRNERRRQDEIFKVLRAVERRTRAR